MRTLLALFSVLVLMVSGAWAQDAATAPAADPAISDLIRILEDDTARAALIEKLKASEPTPAEPTTLGPTDLSIARQLAEYTRSVAEGASQTVRAVGAVFVNLRDAFDGTTTTDMAALRDLAVNLGIVIVGLFGSFFLLRLIAAPLIKKIALRVDGRSIAARIGGAVLAFLVDGAVIVLSWALGYVLALNAGTFPNGSMGINQTLLLNAFLVVQLSKLVQRTVLSPTHSALRLLPVTDDNAAYWSFWLSRIISLIGYAFMFVAPVVSGVLTPAAGAAVQVLVMATTVTIGVIVVLQNKNDVRVWLDEVAARRGQDGTGRLLVILGRHWHVLAIVYLLALLVVWFANPEEALPFMLAASAQSLIAIVIGMLVTTFVNRFVNAGLSLPEDVRTRLPLLESRLRAFVPGVMTVIVWIVLAAVVVSIGQAWGLFDFIGWLASEEGLAVAGSLVSAALIVLVAIVLHVVVASWVEYRLNTAAGKTPSPREKTLLNLFKNAFTIALAVFGTMLALAQIGVNIAPLLAGAGVVGLAIGFGAQKLVQDIITGIFIQFENVMNEGDSVEVAGRSGVVEKLTIRSVTIRDMSGTIHLIPFSSVDQVSNMVRGFSFYVAEIEVAYDSDIDEVKQTMRDAFDQLMATEHSKVIIDDLDLTGLIALTPTSMKLRARIKTLAGKQWGPGRWYSETLKRMLEERGIRRPIPKVSYIPGPGGLLTDEGSG